MKVLIISSGHSAPLTEAVSQVNQFFSQSGIETLLCIADESVQGCTGCGKCWKKHRCVFEDGLNQAADQMDAIGGIIVLSDVIYGQLSEPLNDFMSRLTYCVSDRMADKPAAYIPCGRAYGAEQAVNRMQEYFSYAGMIILSAKQHHLITADSPDNEETVHALCKRMKWLMHCLEGGEEHPEGTYTRTLDYVR